MLEKYYNKFDIVSPTYPELTIDGADNVDMKYLKSLKLKNNNLKILPRFHCSQTFTINDLLTLFSSSTTMNNFLKILSRRIKANKFDGVLFDCIQLWLDETVYNTFYSNFLPALSQSLHNNNKELIFTLFPYSETITRNFVNSKHFSDLAQYIDYFNIMTYDYIQYHSLTQQETQNNHIFNVSLT